MEEIRTKNLPIIPLRGVAVLPWEIMHCDIGRRKSLAAMELALSGDGLAFFTTQFDPKQQDVKRDDMQMFGTVCRIRQVFRIQGDSVHLLVTGVRRARIVTFTEENEHFAADVEYLDDEAIDAATEEALRRRIAEDFVRHSVKRDRLTQEQRETILACADFSQFLDLVGQQVVQKLEDKQRLIEQAALENRAVTLLTILTNELTVMEINERIQKKVKAAIEKNQKEFVLREQLKAVREELGDGEDEAIAGYRRRMEEKTFPDQVRETLEKQIERFAELPQGAHEAPMMQSYIELMLDLPWTEKTEDNLDLFHARSVLDRDHYGMEKVKERIIECLAVQKLTNDPQGQILCLVGPPGVGKTSIVKAIAEAMGRKFVRMSLGGVRDEAEIRGHRRTYIGAQPGRVIDAMRKAGTINPVLLFDEIDKLSSDVHGDPASAMLEVLDSAQNSTFADHFLELPYDLSKCMLLTTANDLGTIPRPLLDRMEVIEVPGYLMSEKREIAVRHLIPKQLRKNGLKRTNLRFTDAGVDALIDGYTREAGVRELERVIGSVCRKAACEVVSGKTRLTASENRIAEWIGPKKFHKESDSITEKVGVVTGLAWTAVGGTTLDVEVACVPGKGNLQLTGQLGDVMQESAKAAMTYVRANAERFGLDAKAFETLDIHIHVPEGAVPKDGPSAGVTMTTALVSALTGIAVRGDVAMTGEVTLRGRVLPIGGLREKLLAALRADKTTVILPRENREDLYDVPGDITAMLRLVFADSVDTVLDTALATPILHSEPILNRTAGETHYGTVCH